MWKDDYRVIRETLSANKEVIKLLMERAELIIRCNLLERPDETISTHWRDLIAGYPKKVSELMQVIDGLPLPTDTPTEDQLDVLKSLCMGGPLEIAFNLPVIIRINNPNNAPRTHTIGAIARRMLEEAKA